MRPNGTPGKKRPAPSVKVRRGDFQRPVGAIAKAVGSGKPAVINIMSEAFRAGATA
jgi:DNA-binding Lrp family transcriptional regulator